VGCDGRQVPAAPRYPLMILAGTIAGFVVTSAIDVPPVWAAWLGVVALAVPALKARRTTWWRMVNETSPGFVFFVLALGVIFQGVNAGGVHDALARLVPDGTDLPALIGLALLGGLLANLLNNLPATLALLPLVAASPLAVLAVLVGVNVGPNLTFAGSLATLLWRRQLTEPQPPVGPGVPPARRTKHPPDASRRDRGPVGVSGGDRRMIIGTNRRRAGPGVGSRRTVREL
jgi:arsenical pump membrane protein